MAVLATCEHCAVRLRFQGEHAGKTARCRACGEPILVVGETVPDHDIFVSYSFKDKPTMDLVLAALEEKGIRCWVAPRDILPGKPWAGAILDAIRDVKVMVLIYSSHANASPQVLREVDVAVGGGVIIIPFRIENTPMSKEMEYYISSAHWLNALGGSMDDHIAKLTKTARRLLVPAPFVTPPSLPAGSESTQPWFRWLVVSSLVVAALVIVALALVIWQMRTPAREPVVAHTATPSAVRPAVAITPAPLPPTVAAPASAPTTQSVAASPPPPIEETPAALEMLADLFVSDRISGAEFKLGRVLLNTPPSRLGEYDVRRRDRFVAMLQGRLEPAALSTALAAIETPASKAARLGLEIARATAAAQKTLAASFVALDRFKNIALAARIARDALAELLKPAVKNDVVLRLPTYAMTNSAGILFVRIAPGEFTMGSPLTEPGRHEDETPHSVKITKPFWLAAHLVTRDQFAAFVKDAGYLTDGEREGWALAWGGAGAVRVDRESWRDPGFAQWGDKQPVIVVSWNDANAYCRWLSKKDSKKYRLPTEAEWEFACRGGTRTAYFWGDSEKAGEGFANCADYTFKARYPNWPAFPWSDGYIYTSPAGVFKPNELGLYDMIGNVWEWCSDYYGPYPHGTLIDPTGPAHGEATTPRVLRGGSWGDVPRSCRTACRAAHQPGYRADNVGFRVALTAD